MASDTLGRVSVTMLWKTVNERRIVTSENRTEKKEVKTKIGRGDACLFTLQRKYIFKVLLAAKGIYSTTH
jgi:hypothetical protein